MDGFKFCPECGTKLPADAKFCGSCGATLSDVKNNENTAPVIDDSNASSGYNPGSVSDTKGAEVAAEAAAAVSKAASATATAASGAASKAVTWAKNNKKIAAIGGGVLVVLIIMICVGVSLGQYQRIDAEELFDVTFSGLDSCGVPKGELKAYDYYMYASSTAASTLSDAFGIDEDTVNEFVGSVSSSATDTDDISPYFALNTDTLTGAWTKADDATEATKMRSALLKTNADGDYILKLTFDKEDGLSNGDKVKCTVDYDKDYLKKNKIKLKNTEFTVEVKDLKEGEAFDYFDGVTVTFEGISGKGYADVNTYDAPSCISYDYEYFSSLSNGDTYTVTAKYAYGDLQKTGDKYWFTYNDTYYIVDSEKATKDFPVSGLTELKAVDPFDGLAFETSGGLPYLKVTGVNTDGVEETVRNNVYYSIESYDGVLNVGDTFTVKASASYYLESEGYTLEGVDSDGYVYKEYTIDDSYPSYVTSDDGIAAAESVRSQIDDLILDMRTDIKGTWYIGGVDLGGDVTSIDSFDKVATYVSYTNKKNYDSIGWNSVNSVIELYKIKVTLEVDEDDEDATGDGTKTFYAAITINDVVKSGDEYSANNTPSAAYYDSESDFESQVVDVEDYSVTKCGD